jgi:ribokinase
LIDMGNRLLVVGSINIDLVAATQRIPLAGETVLASSFQTFPGGKGANQAYAAARLGAAVSMIGKVGNDSFGPALLNSLESAGVDGSAIQVVPTSSGLALITTAANGENAIVVVAGANAHVLPSDLDDYIELIRRSAIILTQLEIPMETVEHLASLAEAEKIPLVLDPAPARTLPSSLLARVTWLTPNETETCTLLRMAPQELAQSSLKVAANRLMQSGPRNVLLKLGSRGCYIAQSNGRHTLVPANPVQAVDATGAGDAFNAAFATALIEGKDPVSSASFAAAVAAISVTRHGAQPSMPARNEVDAFLADRSDLERAR